MKSTKPKLKIENLQTQIEAAFESQKLTSSQIKAVDQVISYLDTGSLRVAEQINGKWQTHQWLKKAILLFFKKQKLTKMKAGAFEYFDKIPTKKWSPIDQVRVVPHALVRRGAHVESGAILMPSYINIGAYVGASTMVDTWATVGSCAQIGRHVHLSGGVGIGGVLEPLQADPVIIEDNVFVGSRCVIVEGMRVEEGAVLGAGLVLTASTKIFDVTQNEAKLIKGHIPKNSVVIPGTTSKKFAAGEYGVPCALIIGKRSDSTDKKVSLNQTLRDFDISAS